MDQLVSEEEKELGKLFEHCLLGGIFVHFMKNAGMKYNERRVIYTQAKLESLIQMEEYHSGTGSSVEAATRELLLMTWMK